MKKIMLLLFFIVFILSGCVSQETFDSTIKEKETLENNYNDLKQSFEELKKENGELNKENSTLKEKLALYRNELNGESESNYNNLNSTVEEEYINNLLVLYDFNAKYYDSLLDGRIPGVEFKLKNKGTRTLSLVEVTVYFLDDNGNPFAEERYTPIYKGAIYDNDKSLKPNYVWQLENNRFYNAKSVPSEWKAGNAEYKITKIEFTD